MFIDWKLSRNEKVCVGEYALKKEGILLADSTIITYGSGSAGCWKTRAREENSRPRSCTTVFTLADYRATQQTRQRIAQCKPSFTLCSLVQQSGEETTTSYLLCIKVLMLENLEHGRAGIDLIDSSVPLLKS